MLSVFQAFLKFLWNRLFSASVFQCFVCCDKVIRRTIFNEFSCLLSSVRWQCHHKEFALSFSLIVLLRTAYHWQWFVSIAVFIQINDLRLLFLWKVFQSHNPFTYCSRYSVHDRRFFVLAECRQISHFNIFFDCCHAIVQKVKTATAVLRFIIITIQTSFTSASVLHWRYLHDANIFLSVNLRHLTSRTEASYLQARCFSRIQDVSFLFFHNDRRKILRAKCDSWKCVLLLTCMRRRSNRNIVATRRFKNERQSFVLLFVIFFSLKKFQIELLLDRWRRSRRLHR